MTTKFLRFLTFIPFLVLASVADASVVTFGDGPGIFADGYTENGMTISTSSTGFRRIVDWQSYSGGDASQTVGERELLDNDGAVYEFSLVSGDSFDLLSLDIEDPAGTGTLWSTFGQFFVIGSNGTKILLGADSFGTQAFGTAFIGISSFSIHFDTLAQGTIDNISFDSSIVPIPAAVWLFGSALLGLTGITRRSGEMTKAT